MAGGVTYFHLVACSATKLERMAPARQMYCSQWFTKVRKLIEQRGEPWAILSAQYRLLEPDAVIFPYNRTLRDMSKAERIEWADMVHLILPALVYNVTGQKIEDVQIVIWGGEHYREHLAERLRAKVPLLHLGIGRQLGQLTQWLDGSEELLLAA